MASVNKVILVGNLGKDPEVRYLSDGATVVNLTIATSSSWKDKTTGVKKEETEWHRVVLYGRQAEIVSQYCKKGTKLYIEGRLRTRKWQDQSGADRYTTEIVGDNFQMLGGKQEQGQEHKPQETNPRSYADVRNKPMQQDMRGPSNIDDFDDDLPF